MIRVIPVAEHNLQVDPPNVITLAAATVTELLPNQVADKSGEIAFRYIQNIGANSIYFTLGDSSATGGSVSTTICHGYIPAGGQLDVSSHRVRVIGFATSGSTAAITIVRRKDLTKITQGLLSNVQQ